MQGDFVRVMLIQSLVSLCPSVAELVYYRGVLSNRHGYLYCVEIMLKLVALNDLFITRQIQSPTNPMYIKFLLERHKVGEVQLFCSQ